MAAPPALPPPVTGIPVVYLVDDEAVVRDALAWLLRSRRLLSEGFANAEAFEAWLLPRLGPVPAPGGTSSTGSTTGAPTATPTAGGLPPAPGAHGHGPGTDQPEPDWPDAPACLLLDVRMPGVSGLVLFERLVERGLTATLPVIFLTGHGDVPTAVAAVKRGAFDFVEKPFSDNALVDRIEQALAASARAIGARRQRSLRQRLLSGLTDREQEVMHRVVAGLPNKLIADDLQISVRTVEVHRARVFEKMNVRSAVELANLLREAADGGS